MGSKRMNLDGDRIVEVRDSLLPGRAAPKGSETFTSHFRCKLPLISKGLNIWFVRLACLTTDFVMHGMQLLASWQENSNYYVLLSIYDSCFFYLSIPHLRRL